MQKRLKSRLLRVIKELPNVLRPKGNPTTGLFAQKLVVGNPVEKQQGEVPAIEVGKGIELWHFFETIFDEGVRTFNFSSVDLLQTNLFS